MGIIEKIPENIRIYIQEIAERMKQGRAVVMVGSGFSKNSKCYRYTEKKFLDWNQLGNIFYKKLNGKLPSQEEKPCYYLDVLKLAGEVQQCFGRKTLDKMLLDNLPDEEYEPSKLHEALLKLNWTDIFTTNYDTLLERTRAKVFNNRYQVVLSKEDLVYSKCPRIIKLHGSFPSTRPFIVTEEDYRRYPKDFAVFVNTVRQALIENVMCMIGFSGDDPNFLNWIGWIRDYLGNEAASKIYMVGVFDLKETERKLYDSRNIILINMKDCTGIESGKHEEGLKLFFEALEFFQKVDDDDRFFETKEDGHIGYQYYKIVTMLRKVSSDSLENVEKNIRIITDEWRAERESDIEWFVVPYQRRSEIEKTIETAGCLVEILNTNEVIKKMESRLGEFLYEYNWRRERCFLPLKLSRAATYENYLKYIDGKWENNALSLCFSLLEYWREHGMFEKWESMVSKLESLKNDTMKKKLYCEKATKMLYNFEYSDLANILMDLSSTDYRIGLEFRISSLLAEMGYYEQAIFLLKKHLDEVRKQMGNDIDYRNYSREAYLIDLLENMEKYYDHIEGNISSGKDADSYGRMKMLKGFDCNPEYEKDYLMQKSIFCIPKGSTALQYRLIEGAQPEQFIKFMERTGMIFRTAYFFRYANEFPAWLIGMILKNHYLALLCNFRYGDKVVCTRIWDQEALADLEPDIADQLIHFCINACEKNEEYLRSKEVRENNLATNLPDLIPNVIAGLLQKASIECSYDVIDFIKGLLNRPIITYFSEIRGMIKAAVLRLVALKASDLVCRCIEFPIGYREKYREYEESSEEIKEGEILEPFLYFDLNISHIDAPSEEQMEKLLEITKTHVEANCRWAASVRLLVINMICNDHNGMDDEIIKEIQKISTIEEPELVELVAYSEVNYGDDRRKKHAKDEWIKKFQDQVKMLLHKGLVYEKVFKKEADRLLQEIRFYNEKCYFTWNSLELNQIIEAEDKWAETMMEMKNVWCKESGYYEIWCTLEVILMEMLFSHGSEFEISNDVKLESLGKKLNHLDIPFLLPQIIQNKAPEFSEKLYQILLEACMKSERDREEAERMILFSKRKNLLEK